MTSNENLNKKIKYIFHVGAFLIYALILVLLFRGLDFTKMWSYGDLNPFTKHLLEWALYTWKEEGLGYQYIAPNYLGFLLSALMTLAFGGIVAQKVAILLPFLTSFASLYYFSKKLFNLNDMLCFISALLYSINPVTVMEFVGGGVGSFMVYSLIPLILYLFIKFLESFKIKYILLLIAISPLFWNPYHTFWVFLILLSSLIVAKFLVQKRKEAVRGAFFGFIILLICLFLIFLPTLIQFYFAYQKVGEKLGARVVNDVLWNYRDVNVFNLLRFAGNHGSAQPYLGYNSFNYFTWAGWILEILVVSSLLISKKIRRQRSTLSLVFISSWISLLVSVTILIIIKQFPYIVNMLVIMSTLRNPIKLMHIIAFDLVILAMSTVAHLHSALLRLKHGRVLAEFFVLVILLLVVFVYNMPVMDGTYGLSVRSDDYRVSYKYYYLKKLLKTIYPTYKNHRILIVPFEYSSLIDMRASLPNYLGLTIGPLINASVLKGVYDLLISHSPYKSYVLTLLDVKLVVIDKKFRSAFEDVSWYQRLKKIHGVFVLGYHNSYFISGNASILKDLYLEDPNLNLIYEDDDFIVFENVENTSKIYVAREKVPSFVKVVDKVLFKQHLLPLKYKRENPTTIRVKMNSSSPFTLVYAEAYDPFWEARVYKDNRLVEKVRSIPVYGVINGFWINETGNLTIVIRYVPQDWFELGLKISATAFALCIFYLLWDWRRGRGDRWALWLEAALNLYLSI